jgi:hypothetical protein
MKAWEDLENDENETICHTLKSQWYIGHGVKIERFNDGSIEIKNTMNNNDHYKDVDEHLYNLFRDYGWLYGCYWTNIEFLEEKLYRIDVILSSNVEKHIKDKHSADKKKIFDKLFNYKKRLSKLSPSL